MDWYKDNRVIREGGRIKFKFEDDGLCSLLIRDAESSDRGRYKCVASNPAGKAQCSAELFIECKYSHSSLSGHSSLADSSTFGRLDKTVHELYSYEKHYRKRSASVRTLSLLPKGVRVRELRL